MLRELQLIEFLFRLQLSDEYDSDPYLTVIDGKGKRTNGRFMGRPFMVYSQTELFNIQGFKQEFTERFENAKNTTLLINQAKEIRDKASGILLFVTENWNEDNYKVKDFTEWDRNRNIEDEKHSADVLIFGNLSINGVFYDRFMKLETITGSPDDYPFKYLTCNQIMVEVCNSVVLFAGRLLPSTDSDSTSRRCMTMKTTKQRCTANEFKEVLCNDCPLLALIEEGMQTQILPQIRDQASLLTKDQFKSWVATEVASASNAMQEARLASINNEAEAKYSAGAWNKLYHWNKDRISVLNKALSESVNDITPLPPVDEVDSRFSALEWATIFYYADSCKLTSGDKTLKSRMENFMKKHNISTTLGNLTSKYHTANRQINTANNYSIKKLDVITPFLRDNYPQAVTLIENDIKIIKSESSDF